MRYAFAGRLRGVALLAAVLAVAGLGEARGATVASIQTGAPLAGGLLLSGGSGCGSRAVTTSVGGFFADRKRKARINCGAGSVAATRKTRSLTWDVATGATFTAVSFGLSNARALRKGGFSVEAGGASWTVASRQKKGSTQWITVLFSEAVDQAQIALNSKRGRFVLHDVRVLPALIGGDPTGGGHTGGGQTGGGQTGGGQTGGHTGGGHTGGGQISPAPIPLPAAGLLLGAGLVALFGLGRRHTAGVAA